MMQCSLCQEEFRRNELDRCDEGCCVLCLDCQDILTSWEDVPCVRDKVELRQLRAEIERLHAIVDKLVKTADGMLLSNLRQLPFLKDGRQTEELVPTEDGWIARKSDGWDLHTRRLDECYSIREAATAGGN